MAAVLVLVVDGCGDWRGKKLPKTWARERLQSRDEPDHRGIIWNVSLMEGVLVCYDEFIRFDQFSLPA
jgi:hypothetical protein